MLKDPDIISDMKESAKVDKSSSIKSQQSSISTTVNNNDHVPSPASLLIPVKKSGDNLKDLQIEKKFNIPKNVHVLKCHNQIKELHTVLRDR